MLKRNAAELRKTRKQVVSLLKRQRIQRTSADGRKRRVSVIVSQHDIKRALEQHENTRSRSRRDGLAASRSVDKNSSSTGSVDEEVRERSNDQDDKQTQLNAEARYNCIEQ